MGKADRTKQYMIFEVVRSATKVLAEDNVKYRNFDEELKKLNNEFKEAEKKSVYGLRYDDGEDGVEYRKQRKKLFEKYGVYYSQLSVAAQSLPVRLKQDFIFEEGREFFSCQPEVGKRATAISFAIQDSIKQKLSGSVNISITKSEEEIITLVREKEAPLSDILKAIDLTQLGEGVTDMGIISLIKDVAFKEEETNEFTIFGSRMSLPIK